MCQCPSSSRRLHERRASYVPPRCHGRRTASSRSDRSRPGHHAAALDFRPWDGGVAHVIRPSYGAHRDAAPVASLRHQHACPPSIKSFRGDCLRDAAPVASLRHQHACPPSIKSFRGDCLLQLAGESKVAAGTSLLPLVSGTNTRLYLATIRPSEAWQLQSLLAANRQAVRLCEMSACGLQSRGLCVKVGPLQERNIRNSAGLRDRGAGVAWQPRFMARTGPLHVNVEVVNARVVQEAAGESTGCLQEAACFSWRSRHRRHFPQHSSTGTTSTATLIACCPPPSTTPCIGLTSL